MKKLIVKLFGALSILSLVGAVLADGPQKESPQARRERLRIAIQDICPVSGDSLLGRAKPVKMMNLETKEELYVCCEDCLKSKPVEKHLDVIRKNYAKAQGHCLIMTDNEISEESKHGIINGHFVYVCCPPCIKKLNDSPEMFLTKLDDLYEASLKK